MAVFKLSLSGKAVQRVQLKDEVLDSNYSTPKISAFASPPHTGIITVHFVSYRFPLRGVTQVVYSFPHGYDHTPSVFANYNIVNVVAARFAGTTPLVTQAGGNNAGLWTVDSDPININLKVLGLSSTPLTSTEATLKFRFYVFAERGKA